MSRMSGETARCSWRPRYWKSGIATSKHLLRGMLQETTHDLVNMQGDESRFAGHPPNMDFEGEVTRGGPKHRPALIRASMLSIKIIAAGTTSVKT